MCEEIKCPYCGIVGEHDFTDMNDQEENYEIQCDICHNYFMVFNEFVRNVTVLCINCGKDFCNCEVNKE